MRALLAAFRETGSDAPGGTPAAQIRDLPGLSHVAHRWQELAAIGGGLLVLALLAWAVIYKLTRRPPPIPPTPRQLALGALMQLRDQVRTLDAYAFSIAVSGVLREYIERGYKLRALEQTSPEFLASIAQSREFTVDDRQLLAEFLERSDMIKFARVEAGVEASESLLQSAFAFVQGGRAA